MIGRGLTRWYRLVGAGLLLALLLALAQLAPERKAQAFPIVFPSGIVQLSADPTASGYVAAIGTIGVQTGTSAMWVKTTSANTGWVSVGGGGLTTVLSDSLLTLTTFTGSQYSSVAGTWTADATGFHVTAGAAEQALMWNSTLTTTNNPTHALGDYVATVQFRIPVGQVGDIGLCLSCNNSNFGINTYGAVRGGVHTDGRNAFVDVYGGTTVARDPGLGFIGNMADNAWHTFTVHVFGATYDVAVDGKLVMSARFQGPGTGTPNFSSGKFDQLRFGLWSNAVQSDWRNLKIQAIPDLTFP